MRILRWSTAVFVLAAALALGACSGPSGPPGPSVSTASVGSDGHLVLKLSDGKTIDAGYVAGPQGSAGVSMTGVSVNSNGHLMVTLSTGQAVDAGSVVGPQGPAGSPGAGTTGASINNAGHLILTLAGGQTIDAGSVATAQGRQAGPVASFSALVPLVEPSIVRIDVTLRFGSASGSGTIIDPRGYVVTNEHVLSGSQSILVTLKDGSALNATVVASDANQDLAIIKLTSSRTDFPAMPLGTIADVVVGDPVLAAGYPAGPDLPGPATFTIGIVSAVRTYSGAKYVQTDAAINPGNSGGCLLGSNGKMIGIPTETVSPTRGDFEDLGLAIPVDQVSAYIAKWIK